MELGSKRFRRPLLSAVGVFATLVAAAGCVPQQKPSAAEDYVPHGRFPAATPLVQALRECRLQVDTAGRQTSPVTGPGPLREIPEPPAFRPEYATVQSCMDAKGYRRAASPP